MNKSAKLINMAKKKILSRYIYNLFAWSGDSLAPDIWSALSTWLDTWQMNYFEDKGFDVLLLSNHDICPRITRACDNCVIQCPKQVLQKF